MAMNDEEIDLEVILEKQTFDTPGRGRKQCVNCKKYLGIRSQYCNCGHVFSKADKKVVEVTDEQRELLNYCAVLGKTPTDKIVFAPTEIPNIRLTIITRDGVFDWADEMVEYGKNIFKIYTILALKYFLGHEVGYSTQEYTECCKYLEEWKESLC